jgi:hypothetical protein
LHARALSAAKRSALGREPGEVDFEIATRSGVTRQLSQSAPELFRDVATKVRTKRALPRAQPAKRDAKIVKRLGVALLDEALVRRRRVGEVAEGHESHASIGWFTEIVDARRHVEGNRE